MSFPFYRRRRLPIAALLLLVSVLSLSCVFSTEEAAVFFSRLGLAFASGHMVENEEAVLQGHSSLPPKGASKAQTQNEQDDPLLWAVHDRSDEKPLTLADAKRRLSASSRVGEPEAEEDSEREPRGGGDSEVPLQLLHAIKCPLCDYTASFLLKEALAAQRKCGRKTEENFNPVVFRGQKAGAVVVGVGGGTVGEGVTDMAHILSRKARRAAAREAEENGEEENQQQNKKTDRSSSMTENSGYPEKLSQGEDEDGCIKYVHTFAEDGVGSYDGNAKKQYTTIVASKRTIGRLYDHACRSGITDGSVNRATSRPSSFSSPPMVFKAFPIGTRAAPRVTDQDERPDEERLADLVRFKPEPADVSFREAILRSCGSSFEKVGAEQRKKMKRLLYELSLSGAADGLAWDEIDRMNGHAAKGVDLYSRRDGDYQKILKFQKKLCFKACGEFPRPPQASPNPPTLLEKPDKPNKIEDNEVSYLGLISWNALGEIVSRDHI